MQSIEIGVLVHTRLEYGSTTYSSNCYLNERRDSMLQGKSDSDSCTSAGKSEEDSQTSYDSIQSQPSSDSLHNEEAKDCCLDLELASSETKYDQSSLVNKQSGACFPYLYTQEPDLLWKRYSRWV